MDQDHSISARPLGAVEKLFWLLDQNRPVHFATVGVIEGRVSLERWQNSLDELGWATPRIWSGIAATLGGQPRFVPVTKLSIPLRRVAGGLDDLESVIRYELKTPFNAKRPPLLRAVVMEEPTRSILVLVAHHSIADGLSLNYWMRDILSALNGSDIEDRMPLPSVETMVAQAARLRSLPAPELPSPTRPPIAYRSRFIDGPSVQFLSLNALETERLLASARSHGVTVHAAVSAALVEVLKCRLEASDGGPLRIFSPIDIRRKILGGSEHLGLCVAGNVIEDDAGTSDGWDKVSYFANMLAPAKTVEHIVAGVGVLDAAMRDIVDVDDAAALFAGALGAEVVLTNLGRLGIGQFYGELRLEAVYGPFVTLGFEQEQCVGVCQLGDRIHFCYTSFEPQPRILQALRMELSKLTRN